MPIEFLTDEQAAKYGQFAGVPSRAELERFFFLNDADRALIEQRGRAHNRLGFGVQLGTVRFLGMFLADPLEGVPSEVLDFLAGQLQIADPSCVKRYAQRQQTHREHAGKIRETLGLTGLRRGGGRAGGVRGQAGVGDRGRPEVRSSLMRWGGCGSGMCCCRGCRGWPGWWRGNGTRQHSG